MWIYIRNAYMIRLKYKSNMNTWRKLEKHLMGMFTRGEVQEGKKDAVSEWVLPEKFHAWMWQWRLGHVAKLSAQKDWSIHRRIQWSSCQIINYELFVLVYTCIRTNITRFYLLFYFNLLFAQYASLFTCNNKSLIFNTILLPANPYFLGGTRI